MAEKIFLPDQYQDPTAFDVKTVRPFNPGERIDNQDGTFSSEWTTSINIEGKEVLVPTIWMTSKGPVDLARHPESIVRAMREFESRGKKKFPRFNSREEAESYARERSRMGGNAHGMIAK